MNYNFITNLKTCSDFIAYNNPVTLILYSHIPVMVVTLLIGFFVLNKNKTLLSKILFWITLTFSLWILLDLVVWLSTNSIETMFAWSLFWLVALLISILCFYFFYVFLFKKDLSIIKKSLIFFPLLPVVFLTPTTLNLINFDIVNCEAKEHVFYLIYYFTFGGLSIFGIFSLLIYYWNKVEIFFKKEVVLMTVGIELFLLFFYSLSAVSSYFDNYNIEFYGLFGMVIFMAFLAYLIVKFKEFNIKMIGAQALVWSSIILIGSQFAFIQNSTNRILTAITLVVSGWLGLIIIRSVKKEDALNEQLQVANDGQKNLIHIMNHQIKGYLSKDKDIFAELLTDDYGKVPDEATDIIKLGLESADKGQKYVTEILRGASAESGSLVYDMKPIDFKEIVSSVVSKEKDTAEKKGLKFNVEIAGGNYNIIGDVNQLEEAMRNLVENSINYTPEGSLLINLKHKQDKIVFSVKDTGVGIRE